jgi:GNAT superfamily N-acetyltransferase
MWWRLTASEFEKNKGAGNRSAMRTIVQAGIPPGILGYVTGEPAGWCAVGPRSDLPRLERSRILKPVDELPVWSITCFFVARLARRRGLSVSLLQAAVEYAASHGASIVEGYPVEPKKEGMPDAFAFHGLASGFRQAGFEEVARRSATRPIMRYVLGP